MATITITIGVLALQGAFIEHIHLLEQAATGQPTDAETASASAATAATRPLEAAPGRSFDFIQVRTPAELERCHGLVIPGGESTAMSLIAERCGLLEPLRNFVKLDRRPVWGTCAGLILLAESANKSKASGQELIGGLDVRVQRNYFGRQVESFEADLDLAFLGDQQPFHSIFIRAPVVEKVLPTVPGAQQTDAETIVAPAKRSTRAGVEILGRLPGRAQALKDHTTTAADLGEDGDIIAVRQGNVFGTAFHPELTKDARIHAWWLRQVIEVVESTRANE